MVKKTVKAEALLNNREPTERAFKITLILIKNYCLLIVIFTFSDTKLITS